MKVGWFCKALICIDLVSHVCPKHGSKTSHFGWRWDVSARLSSALILGLMSVPSMGARLLTLDEGGMFVQGSHLHWFGVSCLSQAWEQDFSLWMKVGCFSKALICIDLVSHVCPKHGSKTSHFGWSWDVSAGLSSALILCLMSVPSMGAKLLTLDEGGMTHWTLPFKIYEHPKSIPTMRHSETWLRHRWDTTSIRQWFQSISSIGWDRLKTQLLRWYIWTKLSHQPWDDMGYDGIWWDTKHDHETDLG